VTFAVANALQTASYEAAWRLANRIGLLNTMIWTHLPPQLFLLLMAVAPSFSAAALCYLANTALASMDVPARQAYLVSIVPHAEREATLGVIGATRSLSQVVSPVLSGLAVQISVLALRFVACATAKLLYLGLLYRSFKDTRGDHERAVAAR